MKENTIPTVEKFLYQRLMLSKNPYLNSEDLKSALTLFAKIHVKEALEVASVRVTSMITYDTVTDHEFSDVIKFVILNAYPDKNIK